MKSHNNAHECASSLAVYRTLADSQQGTQSKCGNSNARTAKKKKKAAGLAMNNKHHMRQAKQPQTACCKNC